MSLRERVCRIEHVSGQAFRQYGVDRLSLAIFVATLIALPCQGQVRSYDGLGNNLSDPSWGSAGAILSASTGRQIMLMAVQSRWSHSS